MNINEAEKFGYHYGQFLFSLDEGLPKHEIELEVRQLIAGRAEESIIRRTVMCTQYAYLFKMNWPNEPFQPPENFSHL